MLATLMILARRLAGPAWAVTAELAWHLAGPAWAFTVLAAGLAWLITNLPVAMAAASAKSYATATRVNGLVSAVGTLSGGTTSTNGLPDGTVGGSTSNDGVADGSFSGSTSNDGVADGSFSGSTSGQIGGATAHFHTYSNGIANGHHSHSYSNGIANGHHSHSVSGAVANGQHAHTLPNA